MLVSVTPCWVAPVALPGPHGEGRVPNVCAVVLVVLPGDAADRLSAEFGAGGLSDL